uniref:Uncharacterized protein n=1 Tax=Sphaerodactylus townsendi TaxID=933632 RepID=A0ACB8ERL8_9SAUR
MAPRIRCTVRGLGPWRPSPHLKPALLKLIEELRKRQARGSGPLRHSLVLVVQRRRPAAEPAPSSQSRRR